MNADVFAAAHNNAEWCDIVCCTHGIVGTFHPHIWASRRRTPPHYPDAVTLDAGATAKHVLELVDSTSPGCSIKDSFARFNLLPSGFRILLEGDWIRRASEQPVPSSGSDIRWRRVRNAGALRAWEVARSGGAAAELFLPALLGHAAVVVFGGYVGDRLVAGAMANRSEAAVGVSNLFTTLGDLGETWPGCLAAVARAFPGLPIVGYESVVRWLLLRKMASRPSDVSVFGSRRTVRAGERDKAWPSWHLTASFENFPIREFALAGLCSERG